MSTPCPLGELKYLRIWSDCTGLSDNAAWYLLSVTFQDIQTGVRDRFVADQWLAFDRGNFEVINELHTQINKLIISVPLATFSSSKEVNLSLLSN